MKPLAMKTPALQQIYNQRYQYEQHKKKLLKIYEDRKSQLGYDSNRLTHIDSLKQSKTKSFIHKFNEKSTSIAEENLKLLGKLEKAKASMRLSTSQEKDKQRNTFSYITPFVKKRMIETEKQNLRIVSKMRNMSSNLNQKSFIRDYAKSQQIKNRLMKYTSDQSRVYLKSDRYFGQNQGNNSVLSHKKSQDRSRSQEESIRGRDQVSSTELKKIIIKPGFRKTAISHYKKQDILKNKVDTSTSNLAGIKAKNKRPNTSIDPQKSDNENIEERGEQFFATQPNKQKKIVQRKVYMG